MTAILPSRHKTVRVVTANEGIFAVMVVWCDSYDGDLPSPSFAVFPDGVPAPFQRRCLARSSVEVMAEYPIRTVIQLFGAKKKPVHRRTNPSGSVPLPEVLVWLSMYRLKSRIQFVRLV